MTRFTPLCTLKLIIKVRSPWIAYRLEIDLLKEIMKLALIEWVFSSKHYQSQVFVSASSSCVSILSIWTSHVTAVEKRTTKSIENSTGKPNNQLESKFPSLVNQLIVLPNQTEKSQQPLSSFSLWSVSNHFLQLWSPLAAIQRSIRIYRDIMGQTECQKRCKDIHTVTEKKSIFISKKIRV